jgi:hypothetical protein
MKTEALIVPIKDYAVTEEFAHEIQSEFGESVKLMKELKPKFEQVLTLDPENPEASKEAKALRLKFVEIRTATDKLHKKLAAPYFEKKKYIDAFRKAQRDVSQEVEGKLKKIEDHAKKIEEERLAKLQSFRESEINPYLRPGSTHSDYTKYSPVDWKGFLEDMQLAAEARANKEKEAERLRKRADVRDLTLSAYEKEIKELGYDRESMIHELSDDLFAQRLEKLTELAKANRATERALEEEKQKKLEERIAQNQKEIEEKELTFQERIQKNREEIVKNTPELQQKPDVMSTILEKRKQAKPDNDQVQLEGLIQGLIEITEKYTFNDPKLVAAYAGLGKWMNQVVTNLSKHIVVK